MANEGRIEDTAEAWETHALGETEEFVKRAEVKVEKELDDALNMQAISIRLPKDLIEQFKVIAKLNGMGYQPLMRVVLKRFAEAEVQTILRQLANGGVIEHLDNGNQKVEVELSGLQMDQRRAA